MARDELHLLADEELMRLVARADADAYEVVYDRHATAAYSAAHDVCEQHAAEVTREAMLAVWRGARHYRAHRGSVRAWIVATARRRAVRRMICSEPGCALAS